jgi:hypothetical protein
MAYAPVGERREKQIKDWLQASLFELRPDKPPEKRNGKLFFLPSLLCLADITSAVSACSAVNY